jgi:hypothetical protein
VNWNELPYHRWPRAYGGWQAGSIIRCEGKDCQWCASRWRLVDNQTLKNWHFIEQETADVTN